MVNNRNYIIDFLRVVSCFFVLFYHLQIIKGGFLAVCTFFVLNGFLATYSSLKKKEFSIVKYYKSRFFHLYIPFIIVVFSTIFLYSFFSNIYWVHLKPETTSVLFGYNNIWQVQTNLDYFTKNVNSPFMHFWYLSILFQFELLFPIIYKLGFLMKKHFSKRIICFLLGLFSFISGIFFFYQYQKLPLLNIYYGTFTRIFSIIFGIFTAFIIYCYSSKLKKYYKNRYFVIISLFIHFFSLIILFLNVSYKSIILPYSMILVSLLSCGIIIFSFIFSYKNNYFNKVVFTISKCTYEIYLFQYPVIFFLRHLKISCLLQVAFSIIFTVILSLLLHFSLNFKEKKLIYLKKIIFIILIIISIIGFYRYLLEKDHTDELNRLEINLKNNEKILIDNQKKYIAKIQEEKDNYSTKMDELIKNEASLSEYVHQLSIVGIGDSVMLGAVPKLYEEFPNGYFDAKVSRTDHEASGILRNLNSQGLLGDIIIINLGTNGQCGEKCRNDILDVCGDRQIYWVNVTNDSDVGVNDSLNQFAANNSNVNIIDWNNYSKCHSDYFISDGIHLTEDGISNYSKLIFDSIYQNYYQIIQEKKEIAKKEHNEILNNKILFYGNDTLINISSILQEKLVDFDVEIYTKNHLPIHSFIQQLEKRIQDNNAPNNYYFMIDESFQLNKQENEVLFQLLNNRHVTVILIKKTKFKRSNFKIIPFYKNIETYPEYLSFDKLHLSDEGTNELVKIIIEQLKKNT